MSSDNRGVKPFISGFTIVRNGIEFDYPFIESIQSALPICDEFIVNVGVSDDGTKAAIQALQTPKIRIIENVWPLDDPEKRKGGRILAEQTNLALAECRGKWCLYLQADEVLHEEDLPLIKKQLTDWESQREVEGMVFRYVHFYATYDIIQTSRSSYRREVRVIRNGLGIQSTGDAQSFIRSDGTKLSAALSSARIFHYGWVKPQETMKKKTGFMDTLYHPGASADQPATGQNYLFKRFVGLERYRGTHPAVMGPRLSTATPFDFEGAPKVFEWKDLWKVVSGWIERATGYRPFEYRNYRLIKGNRAHEKTAR